MPLFNPYLLQFSYPKNPKMLNSILKTLLKVQPRYSHSSCESATPCRGTSASASASYKQDPPPLLVDFTAKTNCSHFILTGFMIGVISSLKTRISYCPLFMNIVYCLSIVNTPTEGIVECTKVVSWWTLVVVFIMPTVHFSLYFHIIPLGSIVLFHFVSCLYFHFVCFYSV